MKKSYYISVIICIVVFTMGLFIGEMLLNKLLREFTEIYIEKGTTTSYNSIKLMKYAMIIYAFSLGSIGCMMVSVLKIFLKFDNEKLKQNAIYTLVQSIICVISNVFLYVIIWKPKSHFIGYILCGLMIVATIIIMFLAELNNKESA